MAREKRERTPAQLAAFERMRARNREMIASGELVATGRGGWQRREVVERQRAERAAPPTGPTATLLPDTAPPADGEPVPRRIQWKAPPVPAAAPATAKPAPQVAPPALEADQDGPIPTYMDDDPAVAPPAARSSGGGFLAGLLEGLRS